MKWLTNPPSAQSPQPKPKHPIFTTKIFSTKSFGPGHLVGAGILVAGVVGLSKIFIARGRDEAEAARARLSQQPSAPRRPDDAPTKAANERGQYGGDKMRAR